MSRSLKFLSAACLAVAAAVFAAPLRAGDQSDIPAHFEDSTYTSGLPTHRDVAYGEHFRQRLDVWIPDGVGADERLPCIVVIHGGAWVDGNRVKDSAGMVVRGRRDRLVIVSISYRMVPGCKRAGIVPPLSGPLADAPIEYMKDRDPKPYAGKVLANPFLPEHDIEGFLALAAKKDPSLADPDLQQRLKNIFMGVSRNGKTVCHGMLPGAFFGFKKGRSFEDKGGSLMTLRYRRQGFGKVATWEEYEEEVARNGSTLTCFASGSRRGRRRIPIRSAGRR